MNERQPKTRNVIAIDLASPIGHEKFNAALLREFQVSDVVCKNYFDFPGVRMHVFPGTSRQFGQLVRAERLFLFPFWFIIFLRRILSSDKVLVLSFDFYSEPLLFGLLSFFKDVIVIHHGVPDYKHSLSGKLKLHLIGIFFRRATNFVMVCDALEVFHSVGLKNVGIMRHPFTLDNKRVTVMNSQTRDIRYAMLSRSDSCYFQSFFEFRALHGSDLLIRSDFKDNFIPDPMKILLRTKYFIFWEIFDAKVSGWVYDAIQCGCSVVMRQSGFAKTVASQFPDKVIIVGTIEDVFALE